MEFVRCIIEGKGFFNVPIYSNHFLRSINQKNATKTTTYLYFLQFNPKKPSCQTFHQITFKKQKSNIFHFTRNFNEQN